MILIFLTNKQRIYFIKKNKFKNPHFLNEDKIVTLKGFEPLTS